MTAAWQAGADGGSPVPPSALPGTLLEVTDLAVTIPTEGGRVEAVRGVSLSLAAGQTLGVVGESGSGKTMLALSVLGLLPGAAQVTGSVRLSGTELLGGSEAQWQRIRGAKIAMVFQDPMTALNPMYSVGWQVAECVLLHRKVSRQDAWRRAVSLLDAAGLPGPDRIVKRYPHELSGGMRQRVVIAMAIANEPDLLIADEPTTALDVTVQAQILDMLAGVRRQTGAAMILISHDLGVVAGVADRVMVMYAGQAVESGPVDEVFAAPRMPYTAGLLASLPSLTERRDRLAAIGGAPPAGTGYGAGCAFAPRCPAVSDICGTQPGLVETGPGHLAACHFAAGNGGGPGPVAATLTWGERRPAASAGASPSQTAPAPTAPGPATPAGPGGSDLVLSARGLAKHYRVRGTRFRSVAVVQAVDGVDLDLRAGRCLALVGESGCGKSTLARLLLRLDEPTAGTITLNGRELTGLKEAQLRGVRRDIQMVFQDPYSALNPRLSVGEIIGEPLTVHKVSDRARRTRELLASVGLDPAAGVRFPGEFSGGQRQRIGIARAIALEPRTLVLDEPVSALDVSIQASVLNLLRDLQRDHGLAYLFIAHDLAVVRQVADDVAVMYLGRIVEQGPAGVIYARPGHPYTTALMSAVPIPDPPAERARQRILLRGEVPSPADPPSGCRFRTRCWKADDRCAAEPPPLRMVADGHRVACHYPENALPTAPPAQEVRA